MRSTDYEARNLFASFWLRAAVGGASFLTGALLAVVLVSLPALSPSSLARPAGELTVAAIDDVVAGDEGWIIAIDDVAADAGGWITAVDSVAAGGGGIAAYAAEAGGGFAAFGDVAIAGGVVAFGKVEEEIAKFAVEVGNRIGGVVFGGESVSSGGDSLAGKTGIIGSDWDIIAVPDPVDDAITLVSIVDPGDEDTGDIVDASDDIPYDFTREGIEAVGIVLDSDGNELSPEAFRELENKAPLTSKPDQRAVDFPSGGDAPAIIAGDVDAGSDAGSPAASDYHLHYYVTGMADLYEDGSRHMRLGLDEYYGSFDVDTTFYVRALVVNGACRLSCEEGQIPYIHYDYWNHPESQDVLKGLLASGTDYFEPMTKTIPAGDLYFTIEEADALVENLGEGQEIVLIVTPQQIFYPEEEGGGEWTADDYWSYLDLDILAMFEDFNSWPGEAAGPDDSSSEPVGASRVVGYGDGSNVENGRGGIVLKGRGTNRFLSVEFSDDHPNPSIRVQRGTNIIENDFGGSGSLGFRVWKNKWGSGKLIVDGDSTDARWQVGLYKGEGYQEEESRDVPSLIDEASPVLIEVRGDARPGNFAGEGVIGAYRYVLTHAHEHRKHSWYFSRAGLSEFAKNVSGEAREAAASFEIDVGADAEASAIGNSLRLSSAHEGHFRLGAAAPAMRFMGGDVVVGTSMMQGFSTSSIDGITGVGGSVRLGYGFDVMDLHFSPQVELSWSRVGFDDFVGPHGELVSLEDGDLATGRLGLSWDGEWGYGHVYGGINLRAALDGRTAVNVSGVSVVGERSGLSVDGRLGASYEWDEGYVVHGEAVALGRDGTDEVRANLGVRIDF